MKLENDTTDKARISVITSTLFYSYSFNCSRVARYFVDKSIEELKVKGKTEDQKGILEKLLEINKEVALIMASDMLFAGVDTVCIILLICWCKTLFYIDKDNS